MSLASAFAPAENSNYNIVMQNTWGHLAPTRRKAIPGWITFVHSPFGGTSVVDFDFEDTDSSPWLAGAIVDHVSDLVDRHHDDEAGVFRWEGTVTMFNNGNFRFSGKAHHLVLTPGKQLRRPARRTR